MLQSKKRFYTQADIEQHCLNSHCWVVLFGYVYDLTKLIQQNIESSHLDHAEAETGPLIAAAGTDISYLFDSKSREPRTCIDLETGQTTFYAPKGKYLHLEGLKESEIKWWKDKTYIIGRLTAKTRRIRLVNMLTDHEYTLEVPSEETINEILERYLEVNKHARSYVWKRQGRPMDMTKTLQENGIIDKDAEFERLGIP